ncbi:3D-(3,5/4)-trihydroxycyclohexane-1,2-dione acylhydrolase (decyclizing), partial [Klebsiella pneumoniae]|nr:3D-(3,5/4)-trihydroxycyclohexane-1,2-dione acylhydrolase (decyclizing) [Klebsiella pneumoniae]
AATGAVTLWLPQDVQGEAWESPESFLARRVHRLDRRPARAAQLADAVAALKASRTPLIVCGGGGKYSGAGDALSRFAERS